MPQLLSSDVDFDGLTQCRGGQPSWVAASRTALVASPARSRSSGSSSCVATTRNSAASSAAPCPASWLGWRHLVPNWSSTSGGLGIFVYQSAEPVATSEAKAGR
jgi:hypothetical protein